ncbi:MAG: glycosyltransferase [Planctomycetaceae bacterium]|jgi:glycosyltransferase involved in cell wall biosynthesis|nr:glycosyltransferase [Planctomycetaceae bacterium]
MNTNINISIIIPVYNVELYLRECLESVVNQTMREIQIICVNDGSTDNSPVILEEYAKKDNRIEIIHQKNQGPGAARNTGMLSVRGKYTYFLDADDWVDTALCEKTYQKALQTGTEILFFFLQRIDPRKGTPPFTKISQNDKITPNERMEILDFGFPVIKLYSTQFLKQHAFLFTENLYFEDVLFHWQTTILANKVVIFPETLYNYRVRLGSTLEKYSKQYCDIVPIYDLIEKFLKENQFYETYKMKFLQSKYKIFQINYQHITSKYKPQMLEMIRKSISNEELVYCQKHSLLRGRSRDFLASFAGSKLAKIRYAGRIMLYHTEWLIIRLYHAVLRLAKCTKK